MQTHSIFQLKSDLRKALVVKAEDLMLLVGGELGIKLATEYLGAPLPGGGLPADVYQFDDDMALIDLDRHAILPAPFMPSARSKWRSGATGISNRLCCDRK